MEPRPGSVGDSLRRARIGRGLSLDDVESALHVRAHVVQALETDDFAALPPTVYTRALIRDYARLVGLDPTDLLERAVPMRPQDRNPIRPAIQPIDRPPLVSWKAFLIVSGVILTAGMFVYLYSQLTTFADSMDTGQARAQPLPTPLSRSISALLTPLATPAPGPTETPAPPPTPITGLLVEARITERSWVQVWADGRSVLAQTLAPGTTQSFSADQSVRMRVGNAGGVDITANGVHQGRLGSTGQVLDASWGREDATPTTPRPFTTPATPAALATPVALTTPTTTR
jgi:Helix-turn-helix domain/Domain of unknown function (DUF4115)